MKKGQKNHEKGLQLEALNDAQLKSIKGGDDGDDGNTALVVDNGSGAKGG